MWRSTSAVPAGRHPYAFLLLQAALDYGNVLRYRVDVLVDLVQLRGLEEELLGVQIQQTGAATV